MAKSLAEQVKLLGSQLAEALLQANISGSFNLNNISWQLEELRLALNIISSIATIHSFSANFSPVAAEQMLGTAIIDLLCDNHYLSTIKLPGYKVGGPGVLMLATKPNLHTLDLSCNELTALDITPLQTNTSITCLDLSYNILDDDMAQKITVNTTLRVLKLKNYIDETNSSIGHRGAQALATMPLTSLDLSGNNIGHRGVQWLAQSTYLEELTLRNCQLTSRAITPLAGCKIRSLDLSANKLKNKGVLATNKALRKLVLYGRGNQVNDKTLSHFKGSQINALTIHGRIGPHGMAALASIASLEHLEITFSNLNSAAILPLANTHLKSLNLAGNRLTREALPAIAAIATLINLNLQGNHTLTQANFTLLAKHRKLQVLNLSGIALDAADIKALAASTSIHHLNVASCNITATSLYAFNDNQSIKELMLDDNPLGDNCHKTLSRNLNLQTINISDSGLKSGRRQLWINSLIAYRRAFFTEQQKAFTEIKPNAPKAIVHSFHAHPLVHTKVLTELIFKFVSPQKITINF